MQSNITICKQCGKSFCRDGGSQPPSFCNKACFVAHRRPSLENFMRHVDKTSNCWLWTASTSRKGYGYYRLSAHVRSYAHRFSYIAHVGPIPPKMFVCHHCDNPSCVRPEHLFLGTNTDNMRDASSKNRTISGERSHLSKLTDAQVREIRKMWAATHSPRKIAPLFGITESNVFHITTRKSWKHVADDVL